MTTTFCEMNARATDISELVRLPALSFCAFLAQSGLLVQLIWVHLYGNQKNGLFILEDEDGDR